MFWRKVLSRNEVQKWVVVSVGGFPLLLDQLWMWLKSGHMVHALVLHWGQEMALPVLQCVAQGHEVCDKALTTRVFVARGGGLAMTTWCLLGWKIYLGIFLASKISRWQDPCWRLLTHKFTLGDNFEIHFQYLKQNTTRHLIGSLQYTLVNNSYSCINVSCRVFP